MKLIELDLCASTNDEAWARQQGEPLVVVAAAQTGGRGRQGRPWSSAEIGNLYCSLWVPAMDAAILPVIPLAAGVAAAEAVRASWAEARERGLRLKWPNDILIGDAKCGGILCESRWNGGKLAGVVVGLGLNLWVAPDVGDRPVTSLAAAGLSDPAGPAAWAKAWARQMLSALESLKRNGNGALFEMWEEWAQLARYPAFSTHDGAQKREYLALGLDDQGRLKVRDTDSGAESTLDQAP